MTTFSIMVEQAQARVPVTVLRLQGDIDAGTQPILQDRAAEMIAMGTTHMVLDMSEVGYMGSAGFRAIHAINNLLDREQSDAFERSKYLKLLNPNSEVEKVIRTLGFDAFLDIHHDRDQALESF
ncbi:MAG: STAS domain-containing protein [Xanthomonadales bacterium]|nr:STAS domain-containing protein [Xanthomonadales bacterium]NIN59612.1 STAS domain-containing protein [Xanthomonadales bacterium]NIN75025.1 STAS domain-containing protein [Xanthomonadales bacterium]NIO14114.1 STAS domain-containing protein [Xanthomonadales bacterium]NIP12005.1 STAS domain-containing protein [Xanthomonadales bacterium]